MKWSDIESRRWSADQRKIIDDFAEFEVYTLDQLSLIAGLLKMTGDTVQILKLVDHLRNLYEDKLFN